MYKQTVVSTIEVLSNNAIQVRLGLQVVDGEHLLSDKNHRFAWGGPGDDLMGTIGAVNEHLVQMGYPALSAEQVDRIVSIRDMVAV